MRSPATSTPSSSLALAADMKRRYRSVDALAADLTAYLDDEPVGARGATRFYRLGKLVKRHRLLALSVGVGLVAALIAAASVWQLWARSQADRVRTERRLAQVSALASSLFTVDTALAPVAGATAGRQQLMSTLSDYLKKLDAEAGGDPRVLLEVAEGYRHLADVQGNPNGSNLGDRGAALANYQHSLDLLRSMKGPLSAGREWHVASILARIGRGDVLLAQNNGDGARLEYAEALEEIKQADQLWPHDSDLQGVRAGVYRPLGDIELQGSNAAAAQTYFEKALAIDRDLVATAPSPGHTRALALTLTRLGSAREAQGGLVEARDAYAEAERLLRDTLGPTGQSATVARDLAIGRGKLGVAMLATDNAAGLAEIRGAVTSLRRLAEMDRLDARARRDLLVMLIDYGDAIATHDQEGARAAYRESRAIAVALAERDPADDQSQRDLRIASARLSNAPVQSVDLHLFAQDGGTLGRGR